MCAGHIHWLDRLHELLQLSNDCIQHRTIMYIMHRSDRPDSLKTIQLYMHQWLLKADSRHHPAIRLCKPVRRGTSSPARALSPISSRTNQCPIQSVTGSLSRLGRKAGRTNRAASTNRTESRAKNARARARKNVNDLEDISMYRFKFKEREWKELNECDGLVE